MHSFCVISFSMKMNFILSLQLFDFSKGLKNVETAVVNLPSVFEPKKAKQIPSLALFKDI